MSALDTVIKQLPSDAAAAPVRQARECIETMARDLATRYWKSTCRNSAAFWEAHPGERAWVNSNWPCFIPAKFRTLVIDNEAMQLAAKGQI